MDNIRKGMLHRAFSTFLFRPSDGKLLLQKRANEKITFPNLWTNTCCSHPLAIKSELGGEIGAKNAAQRKLNHELGIPTEQIDLNDLIYLTKIHYLAPSNGICGEHEIDYILFITANVDLNVNRNEVGDERYVNKDELIDMMNDEHNYSFTPWFKIIVEKFLFPWWTELLNRSANGSVNANSLNDLRDDKLHRMI